MVKKYIGQQLQSIADNTYADWCLYVSDDGSTDRTLEIVSEFAKKVSQEVRVVKNPHQPGAKTNFIGAIKEIKNIIDDNDYIMLADQDDVWLKNKLQLTLDEMKCREEESSKEVPILVCTDCTIVDENMNVTAESFMEEAAYKVDEITFAHTLMEDNVQGCTVMINQALAQLVNVVPEQLEMHDWWLALLATAFGQVSYLKEQTLLYRRHAQAVTGEYPGFWKDMLHKLSHISEQKKIVINTIPQVEEFISIYGEIMSEEKRAEAKAFIGLKSDGFITRRKNILKYKLFKSGKIKNIGLMVLI